MFNKKKQKQLEFFEDLAAKSSSRRLKHFKLPAIGEEKIILKISYEKVVLCGIGVVLALTLVFSLGVERGRIVNQDKLQEIAIQPVQIIDIKKDVENEAESEGQFSKSNESTNDNLKDEFFSIQVIAYKNAEKAKKEKAKVEQLGIAGFIIKRENYFLVCAGDFDETSSAKNKLANLKKTYPDCFIKKMRKEDLYYE